MDTFLPSLPIPVALAAVAVIGYVFGRFQYTGTAPTSDATRRELKRAQAIVLDLEKIAHRVRRDRQDRGRHPGHHDLHVRRAPVRSDRQPGCCCNSWPCTNPTPIREHSPVCRTGPRRSDSFAPPDVFHLRNLPRTRASRTCLFFCGYGW